MAVNKTGTQGQGGRPGGQGASKSGSEKKGTSRKSSLKEDEKGRPTTDKNAIDK